MRSFLCLAALVGCSEQAGDVQERESEPLRQLHDQALPYYESAGAPGTFVGSAGATIAYQAFRKPGGASAAIVFAPGRTEGSHTFMQLVYDLRDEPYDIYVIDHRGQGASSRLTTDPLKGHVDKFEYFVADYDQLIREVVRPQGYEHLYAVAHSMGGAITLDYVIDHPETFEAVVLSAPMLQIDAAPLSEETLLWYASSVSAEEEIPLGYDWKSEPVFTGNYLTNDPDQFDALYETDNLFPERRVGRATYGWSAEAIRADQALRANAARVMPPVLMFQAGSDRVVVPAAQTEFCSTAPRCELVTFSEARHELFFAEDVVRTQLLEQMLAFLAAH